MTDPVSLNVGHTDESPKCRYDFTLAKQHSHQITVTVLPLWNPQFKSQAADSGLITGEKSTYISGHMPFQSY